MASHGWVESCIVPSAGGGGGSGREERKEIFGGQIGKLVLERFGSSAK